MRRLFILNKIVYKQFLNKNLHTNCFYNKNVILNTKTNKNYNSTYVYETQDYNVLYTKIYLYNSKWQSISLVRSTLITR